MSPVPINGKRKPKLKALGPGKTTGTSHEVKKQKKPPTICGKIDRKETEGGPGKNRSQPNAQRL